jgi:hypothetical protein
VTQTSVPTAVSSHGDQTGGFRPKWHDQALAETDVALLAAITDGDSATYAESGFLDSFNSGVPRSIVFTMGALADPGDGVAMKLKVRLGHNVEDEPINWHFTLIYTDNLGAGQRALLLDVENLGDVVQEHFSPAYQDPDIRTIVIPGTVTTDIDFTKTISLEAVTLLAEDDV